MNLILTADVIEVATNEMAIRWTITCTKQTTAPYSVNCSLGGAKKQEKILMVTMGTSIINTAVRNLARMLSSNEHSKVNSRWRFLCVSGLNPMCLVLIIVGPGAFWAPPPGLFAQGFFKRFRGDFPPPPPPPPPRPAGIGFFPTAAFSAAALNWQFASLNSLLSK